MRAGSIFRWFLRLTDGSRIGRSTRSPPTTAVDGVGDACTLSTVPNEEEIPRTVLEEVGTTPVAMEATDTMLLEVMLVDATDTAIFEEVLVEAADDMVLEGVPEESTDTRMLEGALEGTPDTMMLEELADVIMLGGTGDRIELEGPIDGTAIEGIVDRTGFERADDALAVLERTTMTLELDPKVDAIMLVGAADTMSL